VLKAAINGARSRTDCPIVPITPEEIAREARAAVRAGAGALHVHIRGRDGRESYDPDDAARVVCALRDACPGVPLGVGTGLWVTRDPALRLALVRDWKELPDFASVNYHEDGSPELALLLLERGVAVEGALWTPDAARALAASGIADRCLRILIEPLQPELDRALATCAAIEQVLDESGLRAPRLLHGIGATAWALVAEASRRGYDTRIGLEDTLVLPDGSAASGNAALVAAALRVIRDHASPRRPRAGEIPIP
jgi:uncharacterized protein (DUF849 family)